MQLVSYLQESALAIDWHNTAYSILGLRLGQNSLPTRMAKWYAYMHYALLPLAVVSPMELTGIHLRLLRLEGYFGRTASAHFFVTKAMLNSLSSSWRLS